MNYSYFKILFIIFLNSLTLLLANVPEKIALSPVEKDYIVNNSVVKVCVDPVWTPFEVLDKDGKHIGIAADLLRLVAQRVGLNLEIVNVSTWDESVKKMKAKECDIFSFVNQTEERSKWLIFTETLFEDPNVFITRETHPYISDAHNLVNQSIAIPEDTSMIERFKKDFPNLKIIPVISEEDAIKAVDDKQADMTVRSLIVAAYTIKKEGLFNLKIAGQPYEYKNQLRIAVQKDKQILRDILNQGVLSINNLEKEEIVNKHISIVIKQDISKKIITTLLIVVCIIFIVIIWNYTLRKKIKIAVEQNTEAQKQLYQLSKEAEIGKMIANISHQWRGPLTKIGAINLEFLLKMRLQNQGHLELTEFKDKFEEIEKLVNFMSITMQDFLEFYKPSKQKEIFILSDSINQAISILETKIKNSKLQIIQSGNLRQEFYGNKNHFVHIWMNLIDNTLNAISKNDINEPIINVIIESKQILFQDNCGGVKAEKEEVLGLGLYMCEQILEQYNSHIIKSNTENGFSVLIKFNSKKTKN